MIVHILKNKNRILLQILLDNLIILLKKYCEHFASQ